MALWLPFTLKLAFAGVWSYILHWGIGVALIIGFVAAGYFTTAIPFIGPYLTGMRSHLYWAAVCVALVLAGHVIGARDEASRCQAKAIVIEHTVVQTVEKVVRAVDEAVKPPVGNKQTRDPWDQKGH